MARTLACWALPVQRDHGNPSLDLLLVQHRNRANWLQTNQCSIFLRASPPRAFPSFIAFLSAKFAGTLDASRPHTIDLIMFRARVRIHMPRSIPWRLNVSSSLRHG